MTKYYYIVDEKMGSIWTEAQPTKEAAIKEAAAQWAALSKHDQDRCDAFYVLETDEPDDLDGDIVATLK